MTAEWLVYGLLVSALVSVAAWLLERAARERGWPTRWVWAGALLVSLGLPLAAWLAPAPAGGAPMAAIPGVDVLESIPPVGVWRGESSGLPMAVLPRGAWLAATGLLLGWIVALSLRLRVRRRGWSRRWVDGVEVLVSRDTGPAALGLLRGRVVVPEWALDLDPDRRRLLILHEVEHVRAWDPQLALAALLVCVAAPWNLPLWWQLRRLRLAVEMDCDARVLRRSGNPRDYGSLLLEVGQRRTRLTLALTEPRSLLERRIRMIMSGGSGRARIGALGLAASAAVVLAVACETPAPTGPGDMTPAKPAEGVARAAESSCEPAVYVNGTRSTMEALKAREPAEIESLNVFKGDRARGVASSCGAMVAIMKEATPEERAEAKRLLERLAPERSPDAAEAKAPKPSPAEIRKAPTFTPMTVAPRLRNGDEVMALLQERYPGELKASGTEGSVNVWLFIDAEGQVQEAKVRESSGHPAMDAAARDVARGMEFVPARNGEAEVPVWVALDINFELP